MDIDDEGPKEEGSNKTFNQEAYGSLVQARREPGAFAPPASLLATQGVDSEREDTQLQAKKRQRTAGGFQEPPPPTGARRNFKERHYEEEEDFQGPDSGEVNDDEEEEDFLDNDRYIDEDESFGFNEDSNNGYEREEEEEEELNLQTLASIIESNYNTLEYQLKDLQVQWEEFNKIHPNSPFELHPNQKGIQEYALRVEKFNKLIFNYNEACEREMEENPRGHAPVAIKAGSALSRAMLRVFEMEEIFKIAQPENSSSSSSNMSSQ